MAIKWTIETRAIHHLKPHPNNPRTLSKHDAEHLQKSIEKFGLIDKPIINTDGTIIGGHQRIEILRKMNVTQVECYIPDHTLSQADINELNIRLNRQIGEWDWDILANEWEPSELLAWGFDAEELIGFAEPVEEEPSKEESSKKKKVCPNCGHEF